MFEGQYAEYVIRQRQQEIARGLTLPRMERVDRSWEERPVLSTDWHGWSWRRAGAVLGTVGMALVASVAIPASLQGAAWGLREILGLVIR